MATETAGPDFSASVVLSTLVGYLGADAWRTTDSALVLWPERLLRSHITPQRSFSRHIQFAAAAAPGLPCHKALMSLIEELWHAGYARGGGHGIGLSGSPVFPSSEEIGLFSGLWKLDPCETVEPPLSPSTTVHNSPTTAASPPTTNTRWVNFRASPLFALAMEIVAGDWGASWATHIPSTSTEPFRRLSHSIFIKLTTVQSDPEFSALSQPSTGYKLTGIASIALLPILAISIAVIISRRVLPLCWLYGPSVAAACMLFAPEREAIKPCQACLSPTPTAECSLDAVLPKNHGILHITGPRCIILQLNSHVGEPIRYPPRSRTGRNQEGRLRSPPSEAVSFALIILSLLSFPSGLVSLMWLPNSVRWVWLGWQVIGTSFQYMVRERSSKGLTLFSGLQQLPRRPSYFVIPTAEAAIHVQCEVEWKTYEHILELMNAAEKEMPTFPVLQERWT